MPRVSTTVDTSSPVAGMPTDVIVPNNERPMSFEDISRYAASNDPNKLAIAERQLALRKMMREEQALEDVKEQNKRAAYANAEAAADKEREDFHRQRACGAAAHRRADGISAIVGQKTFNGSASYVCLKCQQVFVGVGDKPGQLPLVVAAALGPDSVGGVGLI